MKTKVTKMCQPLSRWKKIVIHDENNKITSIHILDDKEKLTDYKKKPKRKICYRQTLEKKFMEYVQSKDFLKRYKKDKSILHSSAYQDIKKSSQLDNQFKNINKTKKCSGNDDSVLMKIENDQKMSLLNNYDDGSKENLEMLMEKYFSKENDESDQNDDFLSITY